MSQWIWKFGEFEIYHNLLVHNRRIEYGYQEPAVWKVYSPENIVRFKKTVTTDKSGEFRITACGYHSVSIIDAKNEEKKYRGAKTVPLKSGTNTVIIRVSNTITFPCVYVEGIISSDESWLADDITEDYAPVGTYSNFDSVDKRPDIFPFEYQDINYMSKEETQDGILFDFGKETFAKTCFAIEEDREISVSLGESREEALDTDLSIIQYKKRVKNGKLELPPSAFRFIHINSKKVKLKADYEYLPLEYKGKFKCNEEVVNKVWDAAAYTFHLNCREFFLDGIKRDRWVWSGDAYQNLFVNRYLFFDPEIEKRTLIALGGKSPFKCHINTIMDYTFLWIMSLYEYYKTYGDRKFLEQIYPQMNRIMQFCRNRADEDGFVREKKGDWIFIDWAPMDRTGALCGEQILFAQAMYHYAKICSVLSKDDEGCKTQAELLQEAILEKFYDKDKDVFIDSYESGKRNVTRHSNILAYLFLPISDDIKANIYSKVILNDAVQQITTPYFKFYENEVHCKEGNGSLLEDSMRYYYGSMLETGATTLYEQYDPKKNGVEHYEMYGDPYGKSLCHAWSTSPIYLLGRYRMGVKNTGIAYNTYEVRPMLGDLNEFKGIVPVPGGSIRISMNKSSVKVSASIPGGILILGNEKTPIEANNELVVKL